MKRLTCEMCGSIDLMKQDGVFVCQSCGCKYSVEEARKMMIEGTVDVSGSTVKVDSSDELANLYQIARRAKDDDNGENAAKYYDMILVKDPTSWEASFYVVYFKAKECKIAQIQSAAISVSNCQDSVLRLIKDNVPEDEQAATVREIMLRSSIIANMLANGAKRHYDGISFDIKSNYTQEYVDNVCAARDIMYSCGSQIDRIFGNNPEVGKIAADAWKSGIAIHTEILPYFADIACNRRTMVTYAEKIGKYDPEYAKEYVYADKKARLEAEIAALKGTISNTPTTLKMDKGVIGFCVFFVIMGVFGILIGLDVNEVLLIFAGVFGILFGAFLVIRIRNQSMTVVENNKKIVANVQKDLYKKEVELKELTR